MGRSEIKNKKITWLSGAAKFISDVKQPPVSDAFVCGWFLLTPPECTHKKVLSKYLRLWRRLRRFIIHRIPKPAIHYFYFCLCEWIYMYVADFLYCEVVFMLLLLKIENALSTRCPLSFVGILGWWRFKRRGVLVLYDMNKSKIDYPYWQFKRFDLNQN